MQSLFVTLYIYIYTMYHASYVYSFVIYLNIGAELI